MSLRNVAPIIKLDHLTDEERRAYTHVHNQTTLVSGFDDDILNIDLEELDFDWEELGFDIEDDEDSAISVTEDDIPEYAEKRCSSGDIWELGEHRLICGSCVDESVMSALMEDNIASISFTSPPYNVGASPTDIRDGHDSKYDRVGSDDKMTSDDYAEFIKQYITLSLKHSEYVFMNIQSLAGNKLSLIDVLHELRDVYADTIIWDKGHVAPAMGKNVLNSCFEYIHVFSKQSSRAIGTIDFRGTIDNVLRIPPQRDNKFSSLHNATFSIEFAAWFVENFASESVLDNFGGTGTTMIACEQLGKRCYMVELAPEYCDIILQRWEDFTGGKAVKIA